MKLNSLLSCNVAPIGLLTSTLEVISKKKGNRYMWTHRVYPALRVPSFSLNLPCPNPSLEKHGVFGLIFPSLRNIFMEEAWKNIDRKLGIAWNKLGNCLESSVEKAWKHHRLASETFIFPSETFNFYSFML
jgi:hypothetical protein